MKVILKLYGPLRDKLPREMRGRTEYELPEGVVVKEILAKVDIEWEDVLWAVNNEHELSADRILSDGDELSVFTHVAGG